MFLFRKVLKVQCKVTYLYEYFQTFLDENNINMNILILLFGGIILF